MEKFLLLFPVSIITTLFSDKIHEKCDRTAINTLPGHHIGCQLLFPDSNRASAISSATDPKSSITNIYPEHFPLRQTLLSKKNRAEQFRDT